MYIILVICHVFFELTEQMAVEAGFLPLYISDIANLVSSVLQETKQSKCENLLGLRTARNKLLPRDIVLAKAMT